MTEEKASGGAYCHRCGAGPGPGAEPEGAEGAGVRGCPACGRRYPAEYRFCPFDGWAVAPCPAPGTESGVAPRLRTLRGATNQELYELADGEHVLGRDVNECSVVARLDAYLDPRHACCSVAEGRPVVTDLGSENGTFLRCDGAQPLWHGAQLLVGTTVLEVEVPSRSPPMPAVEEEPPSTVEA